MSQSLLQQSPALPIEVCERIIDYVAIESAAFVPSSGLAPQYQLRQRHMDLVACGLTCRAWLARSTYHLSMRLMIHSTRQLEQAAQLLKENPARSTSIRSLYICSPPRPYTPQDGDQRFSQWSHIVPTLLYDHLPSLDKLILVDLNWRHFHPSFWLLAPKFTQPVTDLCIHRLLIDSPVKFISLLAMFPSLRLLQVTTMVYFDSSRSAAISPRTKQVILNDLEEIDISSTSQITPILSWLSGRTPHLHTLKLNLLQACDSLPSLIHQCSFLSDLQLKFARLSAEDMRVTWGSLDLKEIKALQYLRLEGDEDQLTSFAECLPTLRSAEVKEISLSLASPVLHSLDTIRAAAPRWQLLDSLLTKKSYPKLERVVFVVKTVMDDYAAQELFPLAYSRGVLVIRIRGLYD
ncbi:hypothetical protein PHLGIDRAFT_469192 [Phlebiopsis gigantea 11061_1 CR5-6]|uniref:F-box domain-containing protein n=1 Tax=Phlebiopsis gigantea (strain 11061_1 CR5-6) TaxID=745531 RepID=A0A0C3RWU1_PHLG1|nr:hypothetical protein PHLGIDRAFT_469192 [Phlebiopsis gigantea 11061_1 CR5-6]